MEKIILYSTGCPKCVVLEKKLRAKNIEFEISDNFDEVAAVGIAVLTAPILRVNDTTFLQFIDANNWINERG